MSRSLGILIFLSFAILDLSAYSDKYRIMWREDPSTSMVIGWNQVTGTDPILYYDSQDCGQNVFDYKYSQEPDRVVKAKGMNNQFVRLKNLKPNTVYYFVIKDSEGLSNRMSFKTLPDSPEEKLSIIAGGDSRNHRKARNNANSLVAKLRPHAIVFAGDMTGGDNDQQWGAWLDDWQNTIGSDGRLFPIVAARGNHELTNKVLVDIFDVKAQDLYYALNFGGSLMRVYTLNSLIAPGGKQKAWLEKDLRTKGRNSIWQFAQYHHSMLPHTSVKSERHDLIANWATLFAKYGLDIVMESDAHVVKCTYPIRPSTEPGNTEGFIRDDQNGIVFIGEGCWGAPLRTADDDKPWTRAIGSFNQFKWLVVSKDQIAVRTVKVDNAEHVSEVNHANIFNPPNGIDLWKMDGSDVFYIKKEKDEDQLQAEEPVFASGKPKQKFKIDGFEANQDGEEVVLAWSVNNEPKNIQFELQRSFDGNKYETFKTIEGKGKGRLGTIPYREKDDDYDLSFKGYLNYRIVPVLYEKPLAAASKPETKPSNGVINTTPDKPSRPIKKKVEYSSQLLVDPESGNIQFKYKLIKEGSVMFRLIDKKTNKLLSSARLNDQDAGVYLKQFAMSEYDRGEFVLIISSNKQIIKKYPVLKQ